MFFDRDRGLADREAFPGDERASDPLISPTFAHALNVASQVWIVDCYFADTPDLADELFGIVTIADVAQVRIVTAERDELKDLQSRATYWNNEGRRTGTIELRTLPQRERGWRVLPHDRFALVDGTLWHWGATIGGGYSGLNACSYGWSATRTGAVSWFERLWGQP